MKVSRSTGGVGIDKEKKTRRSIDISEAAFGGFVERGDNHTKYPIELESSADSVWEVNRPKLPSTKSVGWSVGSKTARKQRRRRRVGELRSVDLKSSWHAIMNVK